MGIVDKSLWLRERDEKFRRMREDLEVGYLDPDIYHVLAALFRRRESFPVSSCSGRVTVVDAPMPWSRRGSTVLFKKHSPVGESEVLSLVRGSSPLSRLWLVVTGPIFHVSALTLREALSVLRIAREAGMKHSGVLSISRRGVYLELRTGVRLATLLRAGGFAVSDVEEVVRAANEALLEGKRRLARFYELLLKYEEEDQSSPDSPTFRPDG